MNVPHTPRHSPYLRRYFQAGEEGVFVDPYLPVDVVLVTSTGDLIVPPQLAGINPKHEFSILTESYQGGTYLLYYSGDGKLRAYTVRETFELLNRLPEEIGRVAEQLLREGWAGTPESAIEAARNLAG